MKVDNLLGGVSQLPYDQRQPNQFETLENALPSLTHGLIKRPPTADIGLISSSQTGFTDAYVHSVNRTPTERYTIVVANGDLKVFDTLTGTERTVFFPNGKSYLTAGARGFRAFTAGDHTFLVNRQTEVKRGSTFYPVQKYEALLFVRQVDYGTSFSVALDAEQVTVWTPTEGLPESRMETSTERVAKLMYDALRSALTKIPTKFDFTLMGSTIHVKRKDGTDFLCSVSDGLADKGLRLIKGQVQTLDDLPQRAREGMILEIIGNPGETKDNFWVCWEAGRVYSPISGGMIPTTEGVWRECPAPGELLNLDRSTMPHELIRQGYLTPIEASANLARQPSYKEDLGTTATPNGWTTDHLDVALAGVTEADDPVVNVYGYGVRSPAVNGTHASLTRRVQVCYDFDTGENWFGTGATVQLSANVGAGWVVKATKRFTRGNYVDQLFELDMVCPAGTKFELKLLSPSVNPLGTTPPTSRLTRLTAHGTSATIPGIRITTKPSTTISVGFPGQIWPMGTVFALTIDAIAFSSTLSADKTTQEVHAILSALVDAHASLVSSYSAPSDTSFLALDGFAVTQNPAGAPPAVTVATATFSSAARMWSPVLSMVTNEHIGRTLKNITDGSSGTITANSVRAFEVGSLTGGASNTFKTGDVCAVIGSGSAYFVFRQCPWGQRQVGNEELAPLPSFVDKQINEVFFHAGRLGFTAQDFVQMSASGDLYRFFRRTLTQLLDDDPIDIQNAHEDVAPLDSAIQWDRQLFLCSSSGHQFVLTGDPVISPATVRLDHVASYPVTDKVRPLALGTSILFPRKAGSYTQVREVYKTRDGIESRSITASVPKYITGDTLDICGDPDYGFVALLPDAGPRTEVFVYNYGSLGGDAQQQAWHKWIFGGRVVAIDFFDGYLYLVVYRGAAVRLEKLCVSAPPTALVDHRDLGTTAYTFKAVPSPMYLRDRNGSPLTQGSTQVRTMQLNYNDTAYFKVKVTPTGKTLREYVFTSASAADGKKRIPVLAKSNKVAIEISNDQATGCAFSSLDWEASYSDRGAGR